MGWLCAATTVILETLSSYHTAEFEFPCLCIISVNMFGALNAEQWYMSHVNVYSQFPKFRQALEGSRHDGAD